MAILLVIMLACELYLSCSAAKRALVSGRRSSSEVHTDADEEDDDDEDDADDDDADDGMATSMSRLSR